MSSLCMIMIVILLMILDCAVSGLVEAYWLLLALSSKCGSQSPSKYQSFFLSKASKIYHLIIYFSLTLTFKSANDRYDEHGASYIQRKCP